MIDVDLFRAQMDILRLSASQISSIVGIDNNRFSRFMNGATDLPGTEYLRIRETLRDLEKLAEYARPFEVTWRNIRLTRQLLEDLRSGRLKQQIQQNIESL